MTNTHYSWHLIPSVFYKRLCKVQWGFFVCVAFTYAINGYAIITLAILMIATVGYFLVTDNLAVATILFHGGVWQVDGCQLKNLRCYRTTSYGFFIRGEELSTKKMKQFMVFSDQFSHQKEHEFRWVLRQMSAPLSA